MAHGENEYVRCVRETLIFSVLSHIKNLLVELHMGSLVLNKVKRKTTRRQVMAPLNKGESEVTPGRAWEEDAVLRL